MFTVEQVRSLNELELAVYQYVMQHQAAVPYMRIRELASEAHVSTTTVLRFCKKMDCDGYAEFKLRMKQALGRKDRSAIPDDLDELRQSLEYMESADYRKRLDEAAAIIARADRVLCAGISNSGYVAQYAARLFTSFGKFSLSVTDPFYPVNQLDNNMFTVAVVFSVSGEAASSVALAKELREHGCSLISVTNVDQNTISKLSEVTLPYYIADRRVWGDSRKGNMDVDFTSQVPAVALAEILGRRLASRLSEQ